MRKWIFIFVLCPILAAAQQTGRGFSWTTSTVCPTPGIAGFCITDKGAILVSGTGETLHDPTNMLTSPFSLTFEPIQWGTAGSTPTWTNQGTATAQDWILRLPAYPTGTTLTSFTCASITGKITIDVNGIATLTNPSGTQCTFK